MDVKTSDINHEDADCDKKQQKRHRRVVKNEIIRIDDVDVVPGDNFANWIKITKEKLLERESTLMLLRVNILHHIINKQVAEFKIINSRMNIYIDSKLYENIINKELINNCLGQLDKKLIEPWNGIVLNHTKHKFDSYKKYFTTSRSWFDQRKRAILAQYLWIPIFDTLKQFIKIAAKRYFNERFIDLQSKFVKSLTLQIITNIFKQKLKLPSTRPHSLISCSILKDSHIFQIYLKKNIDQNILVTGLLQNRPDMTAVTLMGIIIDELQMILDQSNANFQTHVYQLYDEFNFTPVYVEPLADYSENITKFNRNKQINNVINDNSNNNYSDFINDNISEISNITNGSFINTISDYEPCHFQSYTVTNNRFSPF